MLMLTNQVKTSSENILVTLFPTTLNTQSVVYSHMAPPSGRLQKRGIPAEFQDDVALIIGPMRFVFF